jgi:glucose-6-phosphate isomerase
VLGAALIGAIRSNESGPAQAARNKIVLVPAGTAIIGFGDWAEQLIAESTGKLGTGLLPVVVEGPDAPELDDPAHDVLPVFLIGRNDEIEVDAAVGLQVRVAGSLGAQLLLWEVATVVAGRLLGINPFDQPDVELAKIAARGLLDGAADPEPPAFTDDGIDVRGSGNVLAGAGNLAGAISALLGEVGPDGYLSVMAYLDRGAQAPLAAVRLALADRTGRPTTFGWGPRFLHSTGQYHKGGPANGVYLVITGDPAEDLAVPDQPFTFGELIAAQAAGDGHVLAERGCPVVHLHLTDRVAGLARLLEVLQ